MAKLLGPVDNTAESDGDDDDGDDGDEAVGTANRQRAVLAMLLDEALPTHQAIVRNEGSDEDKHDEHEESSAVHAITSDSELCRRLKEVISRCLCYSPRRRLTARQALSLLEHGRTQHDESEVKEGEDSANENSLSMYCSMFRLVE